LADLKFISGKENSVIIISLTRSDKLGFLVNENRLNVGLSRAEHHLILLVNRSLLSSHPIVSKLAHLILPRGAVFQGDPSSPSVVSREDFQKL